MTGSERRLEILEVLKKSKIPVAGADFAQKYEVSRQVIVQDIALLRASSYDIISTNKGYILHQIQKASRVFCVYHTKKQIEEELKTIVDAGGSVQDVFIEHPIYGHLSASLEISSRRNIKDFLKEIKKENAKPLTELTSGIHYHTVEAENEKALDFIAEELNKKGYLFEKRQ